MSKAPLEIGPYLLAERLGRGGMGEVYRAHDSRLGRNVAVKHLREDRSGDPASNQRIRREARALARLSHPSIVPIYDLIDDDSGLWIVMELVTGSTLAELVRCSGSLGVERVLKIAKQVAEGLAEAHEKGILHRDLKTENVLITANDTVRIVDFGLAKSLEKSPGEGTVSASGMVLGTLRSMSPEQARGLEIDSRSDLFSLGVLLYELLTGVSPFRGETPTDTLARVCGHRHRPLSLEILSISSSLNRLVDQLLEKAPERRPRDARQVVSMLERLQEEIGQDESEALSPVALSPVAEAETWAQSKDLSPSGSWSRSEQLSSSQVHEDLLTHPDSVEGARRPRLLFGGAFLAGGILILGLIWLAFLTLPSSFSNLPVASDPALLTPQELCEDGVALLERHDKTGHVDRAIALFRRANELDPSSAPAYAGMARAYVLKYLNEGHDAYWLGLAETSARRAVDEDEFLAVAVVSLGMTLTALGRFEQAEAELKRALTLAPGSVGAHRALGRLMVKQGRYEDAETVCNRAVELDPSDPWSWELLGELSFRSQRLHEAEKAFRKSAELQPDSHLPRRNLAAVLQVQGRWIEATEALQEALTLQPHATLYSNLGALLFAQGLYGESANAFRKALDLGTLSHSSIIWGNLGDAYRFIPGREQDARDSYQRAIQLLRQKLKSRPDQVILHSRLAQMLAKRGDDEAAWAELELVKWKHSKDAALLYRSAVTLEVLDARGRAIDALGLALGAGFPPTEVEGDPELIELRTDPDYHEMIVALDAQSASGGS